MSIVEKEIKWAIYARKSTLSEDAQIQSIADQINALTELAGRNGLKISEVISESRSAKEPYARTEFTRLAQLIEEGKISGLLVWKMDRLSRNPIDSAAIQYFLQKKHVRCIKTPERDYLPEDNALIYAVEQGMANQFLVDLSKNVKRGLNSKAEKGWFPNIPPIGYLNSRTREKGSETILTDPLRFPIVRKMWDLMLTGTYTPPEVLRIATGEWGLLTPPRKRLGGRAVANSYVYVLFSSIFYTGNFEYAGKLYSGKHEPMITMDEFDRVQTIMGKRGRPRPKTHTFPFTGLMTCASCGAQITASEKKKVIKSTGEIETYTYYHCTKRRKYVRCDAKPVTLGKLEEQVLHLIHENTISPKFYQLGLEVLRDMHDLEIGKRQAIYDTQLQNVAETQKKIDRAVEFLLSGSISEDIYKVQKKDLEETLTKQKIKLAETEKRAQNWTALTENVFHFAKAASLAFQGPDDQIRKEIFSSLGSNQRLDDKKLFMDLHSWFSVLKKGEETYLPDIQRLELDKDVDNPKRKEAFASLHTNLCVGQDSNLRSP